MLLYKFDVIGFDSVKTRETVIKSVILEAGNAKHVRTIINQELAKYPVKLECGPNLKVYPRVHITRLGGKNAKR